MITAICITVLLVCILTIDIAIWIFRKAKENTLSSFEKKYSIYRIYPVFSSFENHFQRSFVEDKHYTSQGLQRLYSVDLGSKSIVFYLLPKGMHPWNVIRFDEDEELKIENEKVRQFLSMFNNVFKDILAPVSHEDIRKYRWDITGLVSEYDFDEIENAYRWFIKYFLSGNRPPRVSHYFLMDKYIVDKLIMEKGFWDILEEEGGEV